MHEAAPTDGKQREEAGLSEPIGGGDLHLDGASAPEWYNEAASVSVGRSWKT